MTTTEEHIVVQKEVGGWWHTMNNSTAVAAGSLTNPKEPVVSNAPGGAVAQSRFLGKTAKPIFSSPPVSGAPVTQSNNLIFNSNHNISRRRPHGKRCDDSQPSETEPSSKWVWNLDEWRWQSKGEKGYSIIPQHAIAARRWGDGRDTLAPATTTPPTPHKDQNEYYNQNTTTTKKRSLSPSSHTLTTPPRISFARGKSHPTDEGFKSVGGFHQQKMMMMQSIVLPLRFPRIYKNMAVNPGRGVLLHGPPGCGKTHLVRALAKEAGVHLEDINGADCVGGPRGEERLKKAFTAAKNASPCILFIDEIDAIAPNRSTPGTSEVERQSTALILTLVDALRKEGKAVAVVAASNRPSAIDPALRRSGRLDAEVSIGAPTSDERIEILRLATRKMPLAHDVDITGISHRLQGYMAADVAGCASEAALRCVSDAVDELEAAEAMHLLDEEHTTPPAGGGLTAGHAKHAARIDTNNPYHDNNTNDSSSEMHGGDGSDRTDDKQCVESIVSYLTVKASHFERAIASMGPSILRGLAADIPTDVSWDDVGGLVSVKNELRELIEWPLMHAQRLQSIGMSPSSGALLYGPPGCGKTLLAKAIASSCNLNFISLRGPELLQKWFGESERAVRDVFAQARAAAPCIIFFDEIDAVAPRRGGGSSSSSSSSMGGGKGGGVGDAVASRVLNQLLCEIDGVGSGNGGVFVLAATNRPGAIDPALLRPGRLDRVVKVPLPDVGARVSILRRVLRRCPLAADVDLMELARCEIMEGMSGADVAEVGRKAGTILVRSCIEAAEGSSSLMLLTREHLMDALSSVRRSVSPEVAEWYDVIEEKLLQGSLTEEESDPFASAAYKREQMGMVARVVQAACDKQTVALQERVEQLEKALLEAGLDVPSILVEEQQLPLGGD